MAGGSTLLPQRAGTPPFERVFSHERLQQEHDLGWPLPRVDAALDTIDGVNDRLALVEIEITPRTDVQLVACHGQNARVAACERRNRQGRSTGRFTDRLSDTPGLGTLSVQRAGHRINSSAQATISAT